MNMHLLNGKNRFGSQTKILAVFFSLAIVLSLQPSISFASSPELIFSLDKSEYTSDEPIIMALKLKNTLTKAVWVNKRFYLGTEEMAKDKRDCYIIVKSPSGEKLVSKFSYNAGYPKSDYFELVDPGKEVAADWKRNLKGFFEIKEPGTYEVSVVYENTYGSEIGLDALKDKIASNTVKIKIAGKEVKKQ